MSKGQPYSINYCRLNIQVYIINNKYFLNKVVNGLNIKNIITGLFKVQIIK